jgi:hypothetical protein
MKKGILIVLCVLALKASASHIVGGEFELLYLSPNKYRLNLIYYFDVINNGFNGVPPQVQEPTITAAIFRKIDNVFIRNVVLTYSSTTKVSYTQPSCSKGEIITDKLVYTTTITLEDAIFNSPQGYYVIWERCCRNYTITNIFSDPPAGTNSPNSAGQTFYLQFPPVVMNGERFVNSSPKLFPPLNDYACPNRPYYADFAGTDDDGDSLVYTLTTPLSTHATVAVPPLQPFPPPLVTWRSPYSFGNIVGGAPDLKVSDAGFLTVTPTKTGLFVFAVKCEEFRKGLKIGEVRRDFQMLVVDCPLADPPKILGKKLSDINFTYDNTMSVTFSNDVTDDSRCIEVRVSDADASKADQNFTENISIRAIALNFKKNISNILPTETSTVLTNGSTKTFRICFDKCPPFEGGPFQVGIIAYDDACSLPLSDTLRVTVNLEPPDNTNPFFTTANVDNQTVHEGDKIVIPIEGVDLDDDPLTFGFITDGFALDKVGMKFINTEQRDGLYRTTLEWDTRCNVYDFTKKTNFMLRLFIEDQDECLYVHPAVMTIKLGVILPGNNDPLISTDLPPEALENGITKHIYDKVEFNVIGKDADKDLILLRGNGINYSFSKYAMTFPKVAGSPDPTIQSKFTWNLACEKFDLKTKSDFDLRFIVVDSTNKCRFYKSDTLTVRVKVLPPDNRKPNLTVTNTNPDLKFVNNEQSIVLGQQISLGLNTTDLDVVPQDYVTIDLIDAEGNVPPEGYLFEPASGTGSASTTFSWLPTCSIFQNGVYENSYTFKFRTADNRCITAKADTVEVKINVKDVDGADHDFLPPNVITPNGDSYNEFFAMVRQDPETGELINILPLDNCVGKFVGISIYNRWGKEIFTSESRDFRWYPKNEAAGIYYYTLKYSNRDYKGNITLRN